MDDARTRAGQSTIPPVYTAGMDLSTLSTPALCFALGSATRTPTDRDYDRAILVAGELHGRGQLQPLLDSLEPDLRAALGMVLHTADARRRYGARQHRLS